MAKISIVAAAGLGLAERARASTWLGGAGNWTDAIKWSSNAIPNGSTVDVFIDSGNLLASTVTVQNNFISVGSLALDTGDQVEFVGGTISFAGGATINGRVNLFGPSGDGSSLNATLAFGGGGAATIGGSGEINLGASNFSPNHQIYSGSNVTITLDGDLLVHGAGTLTGATNTGGFVNRATLAADTQTLFVKVPLENQGLIRVDPSRTFFSSSSFHNGIDGRISVDHGTMILAGPWKNDGSLSVIGGALAIGGTLTPADIAPVAGWLDSSSSLRVLGTLDNSGHVMTLDGSLPHLVLDSSPNNFPGSGPHLRGGTVTTMGGEALKIRSGIDVLTQTVTFDGVTLDHALVTHDGMPGQTSFTVVNDLTLRQSVIDFSGSATGPNSFTGSLFLGAYSSTPGTSTTAIEGNGVIDLGGDAQANGTVWATGTGVIGQGVLLRAANLKLLGRIINHGTISAELPGAFLSLGNLVNAGTVYAAPGVNVVSFGEYVQSNGATLRLEGPLKANQTPVFNVAAGLLEGNGSATITALGGGVGSLVLGGTLAPGLVGTVGTFTVNGRIALTDGGRYSVDLDPADGVSDLLKINGNFDLSSLNDHLDVNMLGVADGSSFLVATYSGARSGIFDHVTPGYTISYDTPGQVWVNTVPEPGALMFSAPIVGAMALRRRRRRASR